MKSLKKIAALLAAVSVAAAVGVHGFAAEAADTTTNTAGASAADARFDLRDIGAVTSVKNQLPLDTCWAFAGLAAIESNLIMQGLAENTIDLSERHLLWFTNGVGPEDENDPTYGDSNRELGTKAYDISGSIYDVIGTLTRWSGVQLEEHAPYFVDKEMEPLPEEQRYASVAHVESVELFETNDIDGIKNALVTNGACYMTYYSSSKFYNAKTAAHYGTLSMADHGVTIVGWNDNYSRENFKEEYRPSSDGAWIVKNNWGEDWGEDGYFYLSYEDRSIRDVASIKAGAVYNYGDIYQNDGSVGMSINGYIIRMNWLSFQNNFTAASVFTAENSNPISAVGFYTMDADTEYTVTVYTDVKNDPSAGKIVHTQSGVCENRGYHTIALTEDIPVKKGSKFAVAVTYDGFNTILLDKHSKSEGISYCTYGLPDSGSQWTDMHTEHGSGVCVKAYSAYIPPIPENIKAELTDSGVKITWDEVEGAEGYSIYYLSDGKYKKTGTIKKTSHTFKNLADPEGCGFVVRAKVGGKWSSYSSKDLVYIGASDNGLNIGLTPSDKSIAVKWDAVEGAEGYRVYRYTDGKFTRTGTLTKTSHTFKRLTNGKEYGFLVRVLKNGEWSEYSKADLIYAAPSADNSPEIKLTAGDGKITVKWNAVEGAEGYQVYRYADGKFTRTGTLTKTSHTFKRLTNGKEYGFLVRVLKNGEWSEYSKADLVYAAPNA